MRFFRVNFIVGKVIYKVVTHSTVAQVLKRIEINKALGLLPR